VHRCSSWRAARLSIGLVRSIHVAGSITAHGQLPFAKGRDSSNEFKILARRLLGRPQGGGT